MRTAFSLLLGLALAASLPAATVVHLAPDFTFPSAGVKARSLRSMRGQPVVLLLADSPDTRGFRKQIKLLRRGYSQFASRQAVFMAAFRQGGGPVQSDVPFVLVNDGARVAAAYGLKAEDDFAVAIIGRDGNIDYLTDHVIAPERMIDVIQNAAPVQMEGRKEVER